MSGLEYHIICKDSQEEKLQGVGLSSEQGTSNCKGLSTYVHMCSPSQGARLVIARKPHGDVRKITESNEKLGYLRLCCRPSDNQLSFRCLALAGFVRTDGALASTWRWACVRKVTAITT